MECLTFTDENGLQKSVVRDDTHVSRKRKSTRRSSIIPSSQREPLADVQLASTGVAVEGMALEDPQCQGQVMQPSSDRRTYESVGNYCSFLRSIMDNDMYAKVEQNVLSGLPEGRLAANVIYSSLPIFSFLLSYLIHYFCSCDEPIKYCSEFMSAIACCCKFTNW